MILLSAPLFSEWNFQCSLGIVHNFQTPLIIHQQNEEVLEINAKYKSKYFKTPIYYCIRIGYQQKDIIWELETIHHKLYLQNTPNEVQEFSISHGYNLCTFNIVWLTEYLIVRAGLGFVLTHPETIIRNKEFSQNKGLFKLGYYITGPSLLLSTEKRIKLRKYIFLSIEGKFTASYGRIPIEEGHAICPNLAAHLLFGLGFSL